MKNKNKDAKKSTGKKKAILWGLGLLATGVLTFFGIQYWKKNQEDVPVQDKSPADSSKVNPPAKKTSGVKKSAKASTKPAGSKSQTNAEKGASAKPETKPLNAVAVGKAIHASTIIRDFNKTLALVKQIKTAIEYSSVSNEFRKYFLNGVRQTLVNGLLSTFKRPEQQQAFQKVFITMGLKYDGKKWTLSGIDSYIITIADTKVWKDPQNSVSVSSNMVLGKEIDQRGTHTVFENDGEYFLVESKSVEYYKAK
jgi:hypothetical protein